MIQHQQDECNTTLAEKGKKELHKRFMSYDSPLFNLVFVIVLEFFNVSFTQGSGIGRKLSLNKEALSYLVASESSFCDKEGPLFLLEKTEGLFKRTEGKFC